MQRTLGQLSGSELKYNADAWNELHNTEKLNCYDYAFGNANPLQDKFSQPIPRPKDDLYSCGSVEAGLQKRHPELEITSFGEACPTGMRKIALVVDPDGDSDYHFLRQDSDGFWSHKQGYKPPSRLDASGNPIEAPHTSNMNYGTFNYTHMCNYYCIPGDANFAK